MNHTGERTEAIRGNSTDGKSDNSGDTQKVGTSTSEGTSDLPPKMEPETSKEQDPEVTFSTLIWKRLKKGDQDALGEIYDLYADALYSFGMAQVHDKTRVMDAIHDLFVDLYKYRSNLSTPTNPKIYLFRALKRKIFRKPSSSQQVSLENSQEFIPLNAASSFEEELIEAEYSHERKEKLRIAFTFLTLRQQKALHLKFTQNLEYNEIAAAMNISIATCRTLVYRALSVLRKHCGPLVVLALSTFF